MSSSQAKEFAFSQRQFNTLRQMAYEYSGIHTTDDKYEMYYARLAKRLRATGIAEFATYISTIKANKDEFIEFINAITTNVTSFEREPHHFKHLKSLIEQSQQGVFKIWSAGCSTGQEPYSILVNILPICERKGITPQLLATDLDTQVLQKAQSGIYPQDAVETYSQSIRKTFFLKGVGGQQGKVRVKPHLPQLIEFKQLNLIHPWQINTQFDCIFCRNVLIYFEGEKKAQITTRFYHNLKPQGTLFLGHSESLPRTDAKWKTVGKNIYQAEAS